MTPRAGDAGEARALAATVIARLRELDLSVGTAESLTGGLVCGALTTVPGASAVVRGGVVAYASEVKADVLGVDRELLAREGAVCEPVAAQLADGVRPVLGCAVGVSTTGVAGPDPQDGVAVGTWYVAISGPGDRAGLVRSEPSDAGLDRAGLRARAVRAALQLLANTAHADAMVS